MARGINKVILLGHLGANPDTRYMSSGTVVSNIRLATSEVWRNRDTGEPEERTEWHSVVLFGRLAEIAQQYLRKGSQVYIEGSLRTRKWQDREGRDRYVTEIIARDLKMLGGRRKETGTSSQPAAHQSAAPTQASTSAEPHEAAPEYGDFPDEDFDDDIPF